MIRPLILPALGYIGYPMAVIGAVLVFGTCSLLTLRMISDHIGTLASPIAASPDFNVPPVEQIGSLEPPRVALPADATPTAPVQPETSIAEVAPPQHTVAVSVDRPLGTTFAAVEPPDAGSARIGSQAVNVRAAPSKDAGKLGVLNAGSSVRVGENVGGWIHVYFNGGDGWVYQTYLE